MASSAVFDFVAHELQGTASLDELEARDTLRLTLAQAGLDACSVTSEQMRVVLDRVLPDELRARGIQAPDAACRAVLLELEVARLTAEGDSAESPEDVFRRLGNA